MKEQSINITELHAACTEGDLPLIKTLVESDVSIDARSLFYYTPLHVACVNGHVEVMKYLLDSGANINALGQNAITCLDIACFHGNLDIVKLLLERGINFDLEEQDEEGYTILDITKNEGHTHIIEYLNKKEDL